MAHRNMIEVMRALPESGQLAVYRDALAKNDAAMRSAVELANPAIKTRQLPEHIGSGQLHRHRSYDPDTGQITIRYTGDSKVWRDDFSAAPQSFTITHPSLFENFETKVQTTKGETIAVLDEDGNIVRRIEATPNV